MATDYTRTELRLHDEGSRQILVLLVIVAVAIIAFELGRRVRRSCPKVEYRFIPRNLEEEQQLPSQALQVYKSLAGMLVETSGREPSTQ